MSRERNPYLIDTPAVISFSGGRTSGFMLRKIMDAFGGKLPEDVRVCFANTGLEHPKTYEFVEAVERNWGVKVHWLEYDGPSKFQEVTPQTASKRGEPFELLIDTKKFLPGPGARLCTFDLKVATIQAYMKEHGYGGPDDYLNVIGLRHDEPRRVSKVRGDPKKRNTLMPLAEAGQTKREVNLFWSEQSFDLELPGGTNAFGNCVGCFLKGTYQLVDLMRKEPEHFDWWIKIEQSRTNRATFRTDRPRYINLLWIAKNQGLLFSEHDEPDTIDCACTD